MRRKETAPEGYCWAHVAFGASYIALQEPLVGSAPTNDRRPYKDYGVNHPGLVVDDLGVIVARLDAAGYRRGIAGEENRYRKRVYYYDSSAMEWELIEYFLPRAVGWFSYE